ncbi:DUF1642 domain-containing protein [Streptococcus suis]|nr:DUF1642 domain-containing protein [Streptococcus suis]
MNKQEAIEKIYTASWDDSDYEGLIVNVETVNEIISQIDQPQQVVVPKVVATWIEYCKQSNLDLDNAMRYTRVNNAETGVEEWIYENQETFARAWLDGYEVEQERLYTVEIAGASSGKLFKNIRTNKYLFHSGKGLKGYTDRLTETEIKQDFEWAWQFAKEV